MDSKYSPQIEEMVKSLDDKEWQSSLYSLLQNHTLVLNQVEVDMFQLMCKVLDLDLFAQVDCPCTFGQGLRTTGGRRKNRPFQNLGPAYLMGSLST